ncbi:phosphatase PAP2 family protein [Mycobacterium sp. 1423905.2]|uniref:phosphatase PAP2 family protein n=1 Tax=Mycobacterium sp. 1423905.2 TaxID=1856859 RepID=UPI0007FE0876|nr:phosphatase PAP2 family protein [Mycobacterium sp. 1423905.2]OBJ61513.1 hypothetical protein A9W95_09440 [Mycobacterium sp. 1423905.2]
MFIGEVRRAQLAAASTRSWAVVLVAVVVLALVGLQLAAASAGFQGPLHSLLSDYVATPKSATVPWVGLGIAMVGFTNRARVWALSVAAGLDIAFAAERVTRGGVLTVGNGPLIVLTALCLVAWRRLTGSERATAFGAIALGFLVIIATKVGDTWLRITANARPMILDEYALVADHALAQPSWMMGRLVEAGGPALHAMLHWVYIELPAAAMVVALFQLRNVTSHGWPRHYLVRTFLLLGLIGPVIYLLFPVVGPDFAFGSAGRGFQVGDYWPHALPPVDLTPRPVRFDDTTARNCMPSMHTAWALAVFLHSRGARQWLRIAGTVWLVCTIAATLGFGYHYGVDLLAGAALCLTAEAVLRESVRGGTWARIGIVAFGATFLTSVLVCCRYLAPEMARRPWFFGVLIIGAMTALCVAFSVTFFPRPVAPGVAPGTLSVRSSLAAAALAGPAPVPNEAP